jgi:hypothetical protein
MSSRGQNMKYIAAFSLMALLSCAHSHKNDELAWESWKGHSVDEFATHPYFKRLPWTKKEHDGGIETWLFRDQARYQTGAYCQSLGGCMDMPTFNCDNIFSVKSGIILGFEQSGSCPEAKEIKPQKTK